MCRRRPVFRSDMSTSGAGYVRCALCGKGSRQESHRSVSALDAPNLDFRPPRRFATEIWPMLCPQCGRGGDRSGIIHAYLRAAWSCDDAGDAAGAARMRSVCVPWVRRRMRFCGRKKWRLYMQLLADLLRRTGDLQALRSLNTADRRLDFATRELLVFQKALAEKRDFSAHSRGELDLEPYDDFFERKVSTAPDPSLLLSECLERAVSVDDGERAQALEVLDALRPSVLNRPYHEYDGVLLPHRGLPIDEEHPFRTKELAQAANEEFLDMLEAHAVSGGTPRESVTLQNKMCMAMLYQLHTSPHLAPELRDHAGAQRRLYLMRLDDCFSEDSSLTGFIEPKTQRSDGTVRQSAVGL